MNPSVPPQVWQPYGPLHWTMLALTAAGAVLLIRVGRRHRDTPAADRFCRRFGIVLWVVAGLWTLWNVLPSHFDVATSIPLHVCDLLRFVAALALMTRSRWSLSAIYYGGLTLAPQAILTPSLIYTTVPIIDFAGYWSQHMLVVWSMFYLVWGLGKRPDWRSYRTALLLIIGWAAVTLPLNLLLRSNYGFLNAKPAMASVLTLFGPWPFYLLVEFVAAVVIWALVTLPWTVKRAARTTTITDDPSSFDSHPDAVLD